MWTVNLGDVRLDRISVVRCPAACILHRREIKRRQATAVATLRSIGSEPISNTLPDRWPRSGSITHTAHRIQAKTRGGSVYPIIDRVLVGACLALPSVELSLPARSPDYVADVSGRCAD